MIIILAIILFIFVFIAGAIAYISEEGNSAGVFVLMLLAIFITVLLQREVYENDFAKALIKDNKIEWRINKEGDKYLYLLDSTIVNTWKQLQD